MKKIFYSIMAIAALTACNKEQVGTAPQADDSVIRLTSANVGVATKAPVDGTTFTGQTAIVLASTVSGNYTSDNLYGETANMYMKFNGTAASGFCTADGTQQDKYYDGANTTYLYGLYPHASWGAPGSESYTLTIDGKTDAMTAPEVAVSKAANTGEGKQPGNLTFAHRLTKLLVTAEVTEGEGYWDNITGIELIEAGGSTSIQNKLTVSATDLSETFSGNTASLPFYSWSGEYVYGDASVLDVTLPGKGEEAVPAAYTLCAPVTADGSDDFKLKITLANGNAYEVPVGLQTKDSQAFTGSTAGYEFTIALAFEAEIIEATATITDWLEGGISTVPVEPGDIVE